MIEPLWQEEMRFYQGDHWYGLRSPNVMRLRPNSVDNIAWAQIESIIGKLSGWDPWPDFQAQEPGDEQKARDLNAFMPYELNQIKFKQKYIHALRQCIIHGPFIIKTLFDPNVEGGRGNYKYEGRNDIIPVDLGSFFPDPRITDFLYLQDMGAIIINTRKPLEYFQERWPDQGHKVQSDNTAQDVQIFNYPNYGMAQKTFNYTESTRSPFDASTQTNTAGLIEYWYRGLPKMMTDEDKQLFKEMADEKLSEGNDPSECLAKSKGTMEGVHCAYISTSGVFLEHKSYVYDHGQYPFTARTLFPNGRNVWGKGFMRDMIKPQIMLNKFAEIAVETSAKSGNSAIVYEEGAITKPNTWKEQRSTEGAMLPIATGRMNDWKELQGVDAPETVFNMLKYYQDMLQKIPGQYDSSNGQPNSNVTSGEQAKALIAAASTRLNTVSDLLSDALSDVFCQYVELIAQFYTDQRIARVTGMSVNMSRDSLISYAPTTYEQKTDDGQKNEARVMEEYVPQFDVIVKITAEKPTDTQYWLQLAFNLLPLADPITHLPIIDAEAVQYVVQNGRMESMDVIEKRIQQKANQQGQMQQMQMQNQQLQEQLAQLMQQNQQLQQELGNVNGQKMQLDAQKLAMNADQQRFNQHIQERKQMMQEAQTVNKMIQDHAQTQMMQNQNQGGNANG
jgi:hypothetical protein